MRTNELKRLVPQSSHSLCKLLNPGDGGLDAPIRSEIFGKQRFSQHGHSLGLTHRVTKFAKTSETFAPRLRINISRLRSSYEYISAQASAGYDISPAAEWLIENFHLLEAQFKEVSDGIPRRYFNTLPLLVHPPLSGLPRVYGIAWAFVAHTDGAFDEDLLCHFLLAYQEECELQLSEIWALPTTLRVVLMENMRRLAERVAANKAARELANVVCDHLTTFSIDVLSSLLELLNSRGVGQVFLAHMSHRMHTINTTHRPYQKWLMDVMADLAEVQSQLRAGQAADNLSVSNAVTSLRSIGDTDWPEIVAKTSGLVRLLMTSTVFASEHTSTRDRTLHSIERMARSSGKSERTIATAVLQKMGEETSSKVMYSVPSYWLEGPGRPALRAKLHWPEPPFQAHISMLVHKFSPYPFAIYLSTLWSCTAFVIVWLLLAMGPSVILTLPSLGEFGSWGMVALLLVCPVSEFVIALLNRMISESVHPKALPRLAFSDGLPSEHRVIVVIPCMLTDTVNISQLAHRLHLHYLANPLEEAQFALLSDWGDAPAKEMPGDEILLKYANELIQKLNAKHGRKSSTSPNSPLIPPRFLLLHRAREYSKSEQFWMGWERKRGKLERLISTLAMGQGESFFDFGVDSLISSDTKYVVTLDSDTQLPPGKLLALVGIAAHPSNQPCLDATGLRVESGYAVLQPRIVTPLPQSRSVTPYHWMYSGQIGMDPYSAACSEVYQDAFGEGTFSGKGLIHVHAAHHVLGSRLPESQILSHDLLEGALARCAAVTDVTLVEESPFHADVAASRAHRWMRGDWQLLPLIRNAKAYGITGINKWKMVDNLRRTLLPLSCIALFILSLAGRGLPLETVLLVYFLAYGAGPWIAAIAGLLPSRSNLSLPHFYAQAVTDFKRALSSSIWNFLQLGFHSLQSLDAITRALYRSAISRRHLLEWTTDAAARLSVKDSLFSLFWRHRAIPILATATAFGLAWAGKQSATGIGMCLVWGISPLGIWWVSRTYSTSRSADLSEGDKDYLASIARETWRFFEKHVTAGDCHLPPDNVQFIPYELVAHRTSPTNIGLYLLSTACAREFGWISTQELIIRLQATLATLRKMPTYRGHFFNWYETQTGEPLLPQYVSTVDSGNLSAHLLCVAQACRALAQTTEIASSWPQISRQSSIATSEAMRNSRIHIGQLLSMRKKLTVEGRRSLRCAIADHRHTFRSANLALVQDAGETLLHLAHQFETLAWAPEFEFLYHPRRQLLHIGYRVQEQQLDSGFYDLLASEARLTSLVAIAKGDVPVTHWAALGRMFYALGKTAGLRSWSGSMFEYLMPSLVLGEPEGSVLRDGTYVAVQEQMRYTEALGIPWGISESAYSGRDHSLAYQYAPQGVPRLALRRTPTDELVIAPYATFLALLQSPQEACANLKALQNLGARQHFGFIEALDYTPARQTEPKPFTAVGAYMAHHQGMSIAALSNVLLDGVVQRWGTAHPRIQAYMSLLHERAPKEISRLYRLPKGIPAQMLRQRSPGLLRQVAPGCLGVEPTHLLSNGRYHVTLRANGAGHSSWGKTLISRTRDDALRDSFGNFFFLAKYKDGRISGNSDENAGPLELVSLSQRPAPDEKAEYRCSFHADRATFTADWEELHCQTTVWVSPEDDIELRQIELHNLQNDVIELELISFFEVVLTDVRSDESHPAFAGLFVRAQWLSEQQSLVYQRTPRIDSDVNVHAAHFLAHSGAEVLDIRYCVDRQSWFGRNANRSHPQLHPGSLHFTATPSNSMQDLTTGLDPCAVLSVRVRLEPNAKSKITFAVAATDSESTLHAVIDKYRQATHIQRSSLMSATLAGIRLRSLRIGSENFAAIQTISTALLTTLSSVDHQKSKFSTSTNPNADTKPSDIVCDRRTLWRLGISGDKPLILVSVGVLQGLGLLRSLTQALRLWSWSGVSCDIVVINNEVNTYQMGLKHEINTLQNKVTQDCATMPLLVAMHVFRSEELSIEESQTLHRLARMHLAADGRPLSHSIRDWLNGHERYKRRHRDNPHEVVGVPPLLANTSFAQLVATARRTPMEKLHADFAEGGRAFQFEVSTTHRPTRPWSNVLANPNFGSLITESGGGYSWGINSRLNQITTWSNDPVLDPPSEWLLIQNLDTREVWHVCPSAWGDQNATYQITHTLGCTSVNHKRGALEIEVKYWVHVDSPLKTIELRVRNHSVSPIHLRLVSLHEWVLGSSKADRATTSTWSQKLHIGSRVCTVLGCTQQAEESGFGRGTAFVSFTATEPSSDSEFNSENDWTCDRREFFDEQGRFILPDKLGKFAAAGCDPCAAHASTIRIRGGEEKTVCFLQGYAKSPEEALEEVRAHESRVMEGVPGSRTSLAKVNAQWAELNGALQVSTPDSSFDSMVNHWLLYQAVSCRLWAKAGFYQAGGATGFRDQLQDAMALVWASPKLLRDQILLCASRQFHEGDVQHWWHTPSGVGVRTRFSDDLLWLPYAALHYLRATGDATMMEEVLSFLEGSQIPNGQEDLYFTPAASSEEASVYEHCARAIDRSLRTGTHGLPLMGSGDWNDGMNRVGPDGRGESVWLGWFVCNVTKGFSKLARQRGDFERAVKWEAALSKVEASLTTEAWDGSWFKRAFFDSGQDLGSSECIECRIDLIAQAWSVLYGECSSSPTQDSYGLNNVTPTSMQKADALDSMHRHLFDPNSGLLQLLTPPFKLSQPSPGYIQAYPVGVRENGGQYNHAGVWGLMAQAQAHRMALPTALAQQRADIPYIYFTSISSAHRAKHEIWGQAYGLEPYVIAGDVYSQPPYVGRGGWSWYTGAAGWLYQAAIRSIFGLDRTASSLSFSPCLPSHWNEASVSLLHKNCQLHFRLVRKTEPEVLATLSPGELLLKPEFELDLTRLESCYRYVIPILKSR
ncbi:glucoamylase family protein [Curvibacter sp. APW13]|uniref:GH36-type glycosyl hydrolase domain-containing protein n=1 Tax=Curvibacter sp. APW13 TaxID=3077236 RepID=UPI0028DD6F46|nr:glucoamylase family protein [Curvibacter sp. APW13]MDT8992608.1 glucoamylase family protein [Curvibacter sp. APW13]